MTDDALDKFQEVAGQAIELVGAVAPPVSWAYRKLRALEQANTDAVQEAYEREKRNYQLEWQRRTDQHLAKLEDSAENQARFEKLLTDEFFFILANYDLEASREARRERRLMLACARAGSFNLDLTVAQIARVERAIRELEPADVPVLVHAARLTDPPRPDVSAATYPGDVLRDWREQCARNAANRYVSWRGSAPDGECLLASGCVRVEISPEVAPTLASGLHLTDMGRWVLAVLAPYIAARSEAADGGESGEA